MPLRTSPHLWPGAATHLLGRPCPGRPPSLPFPARCPSFLALSAPVSNCASPPLPAFLPVLTLTYGSVHLFLSWESLRAVHFYPGASLLVCIWGNVFSHPSSPPPRQTSLGLPSLLLFPTRLPPLSCTGEGWKKWGFVGAQGGGQAQLVSTPHRLLSSSLPAATPSDCRAFLRTLSPDTSTACTFRGKRREHTFGREWGLGEGAEFRQLRC